MQFNTGSIVLFFILTFGIYFIGQSLSQVSRFPTTQEQSSKESPQIKEKSDPDPIINIEETLYDVEGTTRKQLRTNIFSASPIQKNGKSYVYSNKWWVNWNFLHQKTRKGCIISSMKSDVVIRKILPNWIDRHRAPQPLQEKWETYMTALNDYMEKQNEFGIQAAQEILQTLGEVEGRESCSELDSKTHALGEDIIQEYIELTQEFRRHTEFGRTLGVILP